MDLQENRFVEEKNKEKDEIPLSLLSGVVGMRLGGECGEYQFTGPGDANVRDYRECPMMTQTLR